MRKRLYSSLLFLGALAGVAKAQDVTIPVSGIESGWGWSCTFADTLNPNKTAGVGCDSTNVKKIVIGSWGSWALRKLPAVDWSKYGSIELLVYTSSTVNFSPKISYKGWNNTTGNVEINDLDAKVDNRQLTKNEWQIITIDVSGPYADKNGKTYTSLSDTSLNLNTIQIGMQCDTAEIYVGAITIKEPVVVIKDTLTLNEIQIGWGWGSTFSNVANPNTSAGIGCSTETVKKVAVTGWGSFAIANWPVDIDWDKFSAIDVVVYPETACQFKSTVAYKGWSMSKGNTQPAAIDDKVETKALTAGEWQKFRINLGGELKDSINYVFKSLSDTALGLSTIQIFLGCESASMYIGALELVEKSSTDAPNVDDNKSFSVYPIPATKFVTVNYQFAEATVVSVFDVTGVKLSQQLLTLNNNKLSTVGLRPGVYFISFDSPGGVVARRICVK